MPPLRGRHAHRLTPEERFWSRVELRGTCLVWTGALDAGYGVFTPNKESGQMRAHRWAYEALTGLTIPGGMVPDHLCKNRACVDPDHLDIVSSVENVMRGESPAAQNARKTHCKRGHELSGDNIYRRKSRPNARECVRCMRERSSQ